MTTIALRTSQNHRPAQASPFDQPDVRASASLPVTFDLVADLAAFETLEPEWNALFAAAGLPTQVFQMFAWNWHWCRHYLPQPTSKSASRLAIVTGRLSGRLVMVWPLVLERIAGLRQLTWMGDPVSQYGDILAAPEARDDATLAAAWAFALRTTRADLAHLRKVREDSIAAPALHHMGAKTVAIELAPYLDLSGISGTQSCQQLLVSKGRRNRRRHERRLADQGPITRLAHSGTNEAAQFARHAIDMKRQSLARKGQISRAFADERFEAFFADVAAGRTRPVPCRVAALQSNDKTAAIQITLDCKGHRFLHVTVYARDFEKYGVGALLLESEVQRSVEDGIAVFDLLAPLHAYKMEFAGATVAMHDYTIAVSLRGRLYAALVLSGRQHAKKAIERLPVSLRQYAASLLAARSALHASAASS